MPPSSSTSQAPPFLPPSSDWRGVNLLSMGEDPVQLPVSDDGEERQQLLLPSSSEARQLEQPPFSSFLHEDVAAARQDPPPFSFNMRSTAVAAAVDLQLKELNFPISLPLFTVRTATRKYGLGALGQVRRSDFAAIKAWELWSQAPVNTQRSKLYWRPGEVVCQVKKNVIQFCHFQPGHFDSIKKLLTTCPPLSPNSHNPLSERAHFGLSGLCTKVQARPKTWKSLSRPLGVCLP